MSEVPDGRSSDNLFLIAAVALPAIVVSLFLVASAIPRWTVPPPRYDLLVRSDVASTPAAQQVVTTLRVRDGEVVAELQPAAPNTYPQRPVLLLFDHRTQTTSEVPLDVPSALDPGETLRVVPVAALAGRRVVATTLSPDGYAFDMSHRHGPGLMGELFGAHRYDSNAAIAKDGRVIRIVTAQPYAYSVQPVAWLAPVEEQ